MGLVDWAGCTAGEWAWCAAAEWPGCGKWKWAGCMEGRNWPGEQNLNGLGAWRAELAACVELEWAGCVVGHFPGNSFLGYPEWKIYIWRLFR